MAQAWMGSAVRVSGRLSIQVKQGNSRRGKMNIPTKDDVEKMMNDHLAKIREFTLGTLGNETDANQHLSYMMANVSHVAELMWAAQVEMGKGLGLANEMFKSMYVQLEESKKEKGNEEAK
jgi:hypothetical protein